MTSILNNVIHHEVYWGIEANERCLWTDHGDGSTVSEHAEALATRALRELAKAGRRVGYAVNGVHRAGDDFAEEWAAADAVYAAEVVEHETTTFLADPGSRMNWRKAQVQGVPAAWASCSCGWKQLCDTRDVARLAARRHREGEL